MMLKRFTCWNPRAQAHVPIFINPEHVSYVAPVTTYGPQVQTGLNLYFAQAPPLVDLILVQENIDDVVEALTSTRPQPTIQPAIGIDG